MERIREAEKYTMTHGMPGRIQSIVNIHNPSIEVHTVDSGGNTGAAIIMAAGGGHATLNVGGEGSDPVSFFNNYGRQHDHPAKPAAQRRLQSADR